MTHSYVWQDSFICVTWFIDVCDMSHSYLWHGSFMCVTWLIHMCDKTHSYVWHDSLMCVTCLIHICDMAHSCVWHDWFICVTWLIHVCDMINSYVWRDSFICVTWLIHMCDITHSYTCRGMSVACRALSMYALIYIHMYTQVWVHTHGGLQTSMCSTLLHITPYYTWLPDATTTASSQLTEDFRLHFFAFPYESVFLIHLLRNGTPFSRMKPHLIFWGLPWQRVGYVRGLPWQRVYKGVFVCGYTRDNVLDMLAVVVIWSCNDLIWTCNDVMWSCNDVKADLLRPCTSQSWPLIHVDSMLLDITWHYLTLLEIT